MPPVRSRGRPPYPDVLTPAEWRVLNWIRHGLRRRAIAGLMGTSENAVKYHVANISSKLGVAGVAALRQWPGYPAGSPLTRRTSAMAASLDTAPGTNASVVGPLGQVSLFVRDIEKAERFYRDTLGLAHLFTFGSLGFFDCGGVRLYVHAVTDSDWRPGSILYFTVRDMTAAVASLQAQGVAFTGQPHLVHRHASGDEEWMTFFADPDGNQLALMARVKPAAAAS